jgi:hypothetical protein
MPGDPQILRGIGNPLVERVRPLERGHDRFRGVALRKDERRSQRRMQRHLEVLARGRGLEARQHREPSLEVRDGLEVRGLPRSLLARAQPVLGCRVELTGLGEMVSRQFGAAGRNLGEGSGHRLRDAAVNAPRGLERHVVRGVADEGVLECGVGQHTVLEQSSASTRRQSATSAGSSDRRSPSASQT